MARFLEGNDLNAEISKLFRSADKYLYLISPYIKLHSRYRDDLKHKQDNDKFHLVVVFGKNEEDKSKSISQDDLEFFKSFANVEIRYETRLHAKYYASEDGAILTTMNLYDFSQNNNIEAGIFMKSDILGGLSNVLIDVNLDTKAWDYFSGVIKNSQCLYKRITTSETALLGFGKKTINSQIVIDNLDKHFHHQNTAKPTYAKSVEYNTASTTYRQQTNNNSYRPQMGYCIRTGVEIPFNPTKPMSWQAYNVWAEFGNPDYNEKYCHRTGKESHGRTSMRNPILYNI